MSMSSRRKLGIIGCGTVVQRNYLSALKFYPEIHLAYVNDLNSAACSRVAALSGAEAASVEQIQEECEIVVIATPPSTHAALIDAFSASGRTVICEKPFVGNRRQAEHAVETANSNNCKLFVAHFRRCFPSVRLGRAVIESGVLGEVVKMSAYEGGRFSWQTESGYVYNDPLGGVLFDTGSHTLDMLLYVAGMDSGNMQVASVRTDRDCAEPSHDVEAEVLLSYGHRTIPGNFKFSRTAPNANKLRIECQNGFLELPVGMADYVRLGGRDGKTVIVYARESYADLMDCFAVQFKQMFFHDRKGTFSAEKFINLVTVLEALND